MVRVIFTQNVKKVGVKDEVKDINDGYARNFLIPNKLAVEATQKALGELKKRLEVKSAGIQKLNKELSDAIEKTKGEIFVIKKKANTDGQLFSSVTLKEIISFLNQKEIHLHENNLLLPSPVKKVGNYEIPIKGASEVLRLSVEKE
jgi:large subunit ribosomal protein L9